MICWLLFVVFPRWAAIGASALKRASSSCAWPRAAIVPIVSMSCFCGIYVTHSKKSIYSRQSCDTLGEAHAAH